MLPGDTRTRRDEIWSGDKGSSSEELLAFNGIDGSTGEYAQPALTLREFSKKLQGGDVLGEVKRWLQRFAAVTGRFRIHRQGTPFLSLEEGIDHRDLAQVGWGVVFGAGVGPEIKEALQDLLALRREQAQDRYRELEVEPDETRRDFLNRYDVGYDLDLDKVPYYLLLIGDPEAIPYRFQQQLDVQYAVGRLCFETADEYASYAKAVVDSVKGPRLQRPRAVFFGVRNPRDRATAMSADHLVKPLARMVVRRAHDWRVDEILGGEATKSRLLGLFTEERPPALIFSASHGMKFPSGDPRQLPHQGALLCQDWPGPGAWKGPIPADHYFSAEDIGSDARAAGAICFHFGCYGAGTPRSESFSHRHGREPKMLAERDFVARLPQRLLGHPRGGALAMIAHVERSWGFSYVWRGVGTQHRTFEQSLSRLTAGDPVGLAIEPFNRRYANLSSDLSRELEDVIQKRKDVDDESLVELWTATNDARGYVVLGDPAVRLPVSPAKHRPAAPGWGTPLSGYASSR